MDRRKTLSVIRDDDLDMPFNTHGYRVRRYDKPEPARDDNARRRRDFRIFVTVSNIQSSVS
jgi:hypothetical protein